MSPSTNRPARRDPAARLRRRVREALATVNDPATPQVNVVDMGMIYAVEVDGARVRVDLALSAPDDPGSRELPEALRAVVEELADVSACEVRVVDDPPWTIERLTPAARVQLAVSV
jgi:metal-sulfur cluster biosynthetic enzyme